MINSEKGSRWLFWWALLRLPLLIVLAFVFRDWVMGAALRVLGEGPATYLAMDVFSTPVTRAIFAFVLAAALLAIVALTNRLAQSRAYFVICAIGLALIAASFRLSGKSIIYALPAVLLFVTNSLPSNINCKFPPNPSWLLSLLPASEVFLFWRHVRWMAWLWTGTPAPTIARRWVWALPAILLASALTAVFVDGHRFVRIEQALRSSSAVRKIAAGDFNWIKADKNKNALFAVGHGVNHVLKFDLSDLAKPPAESDETTGFTQSFEYSASANEIYAYDEGKNRLLYFDAETLKLKRSIDVGVISPGDSWLAADDKTNTITIVSEADEQIGYPFVLVDRASGKVLDTMNEDAGNLTLDPDRSLEYLSFFRRQSRVSIYDLNKRAIVKTAAVGPNAERMAIWKAEHELLVTLPVKSAVARLDADTLEFKGTIAADFGVRAIAIDTTNKLLFVGSIATGRVSTIDLPSMKKRDTFYLGPWLRTIEVLPEKGVAYVSSGGAIYELRYR